MKPTPNQIVKKSFGSRSDLVEKLVPMVDKHHGDSSKEQVKARLMGLPNKKLLRLYRVEQKVREQFGSRDKLIEHIVDARTKAGHTADDDYKATLQSYSKGRLLDLSRMKLGEASPKQTPEERMKKKRGRKQLERAKSKVG